MVLTIFVLATAGMVLAYFLLLLGLEWHLSRHSLPRVDDALMARIRRGDYDSTEV